MARDLLEWADLHNEGFDGDDVSVDYVIEEFQFNYDCIYECKVEVETFRGIPSHTEVIEMSRIEIDADGYETDVIELDKNEFPFYIKKAVEKKVLEML